jgi:hypothetical protein
MKLVRFTEPYPPYAVGDITGFEDDLAKKLVKKGVCEDYTETKEVEKPKVNKMVEKKEAQTK